MPAEKSKTDANMNLVPFSWDGYLKDTGETPAPKACFKQAKVPPVNEFLPGMKLESVDPRNSMSYCIATVIATCGPRLLLRLDGSDNRNDFWSLVDSEDIHPHGWCHGVGEQLVPPLGFSKNASTYPAFLAKLLAESHDQMAPRSAFKDAPCTPPRNMFEVGMKLEAIDRKNPHMIGPATVGDIDGDKIFVQFDGWRGAFDYWCKYSSRDIFPVGWCSATGHPIQPPGNKGNALKSRPSASRQVSSMSLNVHVDSSGYASIPSPGSARSAGSRKLVSPSASISPAADSSANSVTAYINQTCKCGPILNQTAIIRLPLHYGPYSINKIQRRVTQALVDSGNSPAAVFNLLPSGSGTVSVSAKVSGKTHSNTLPALTTEPALQSYICNLLERLEACPNLVTLHPPHRICNKCHSGHIPPAETNKRPNQLAVEHAAPPPKRANPDRLRPTHSLPIATRTNSASAVSSPLNGHGPSRTAQSASSSLAFPTEVSNRLTNGCHAHTSTVALQNIDAENWTCSEVVEYIRSTDPSLSKHTHLIHANEIDGRAFLLLTSDIAIKYLDLKVGPALKLCSLIDQLKFSMKR